MSEENNNYKYASDMIDEILPDLQTARNYYKATGDISNQMKIDEKINRVNSYYQQSKAQKEVEQKSATDSEAMKAQVRKIFGLK